jgi:hypothetical protein
MLFHHVLVAMKCLSFWLCVWLFAITALWLGLMLSAGWLPEQQAQQPQIDTTWLPALPPLSRALETSGILG